MKANVIITFKAKPEKLSDFKEILESVKLSLPKAKGCLGVQIFNDINSPCTFTLIEIWDSETSHKSHIARVIESGDWDNIASHLESDPESSYNIEF